jgi:hypothetical protein
MRVISIAAAVLAVIALFFGNCLTCPQMAASHNCCHGNQRCHHNQPVTQVCQAPALNHFVKVDKVGSSVTPSVVSLTAETVERLGVAAPGDAAIAVPDYAPPDLISLHSSLRI